MTKGLAALAISGRRRRRGQGDERREAGEIRSAVWSPAEGRVRALALLRTALLPQPLTAGGAAVEVIQGR